MTPPELMFCQNNLTWV